LAYTTGARHGIDQQHQECRVDGQERHRSATTTTTTTATAAASPSTTSAAPSTAGSESEDHGNGQGATGGGESPRARPPGRRLVKLDQIQVKESCGQPRGIAQPGSRFLRAVGDGSSDDTYGHHQFERSPEVDDLRPSDCPSGRTTSEDDHHPPAAFTGQWFPGRFGTPKGPQCSCAGPPVGTRCCSHHRRLFGGRGRAQVAR